MNKRFEGEFKNVLRWKLQHNPHGIQHPMVNFRLTKQEKIAMNSIGENGKCCTCSYFAKNTFLQKYRDWLKEEARILLDEV